MPCLCTSLHVTEHSEFHPLLSVLIFCYPVHFVLFQILNLKHNTSVIFGLTEHQCIVEDQWRDFGSGVGSNRGLWCCPLRVESRQEWRLVTRGTAVLCFLSGTSSLQLKAEEIWFSCTFWAPWKWLTALSFWNWKGSTSACGSAAKIICFNGNSCFWIPTIIWFCWLWVWSICRLRKISAASIWHQF